MRLHITAFRRLLLLLLAALCLAACKTEPDLPADPHVPLVNPFIGVWQTGGEYWQFRPDGTGGRAATEAESFPNTFSFFVYAGQDVQTAPSRGSLLMLEDSGDTVTVTRYTFLVAEGYWATLTLPSGGPSTTLQRVSGGPQALSMRNELIGEWSADWTSVHGLTWSLKYRADGTVKVFHHEVRHQFENAYALRGNTLVIYGEMRFAIAPIIAKVTSTGSGKFQVQETQERDPDPAQWAYTKVSAAKWL